MLRFLLAAALLPALLLMVYIYRMDTIEKESGSLLLRLALLGAAACLPASILEGLFTPLLSRWVDSATPAYYAWEAFLIVAVSEEGCKLLALRLGSWRSPEFNYRFDGIVYAVFVGLGFAALENLLYVFNYGPSVIVNRGLLAIPGHMTFGVFMGLSYAHAKIADLYGDDRRRRRSMLCALVIPCLLHGFYDFCLMSGIEILSLFFLLFVVALDVSAFLIVRGQSRRDRPLS